MKFYNWYGNLSKENPLDAYIIIELNIAKWEIELTLFNLYFGIGIVFGKPKYLGKLK